MDIDLLSKMIRELILDNDSVCLPGLGSFVAEIVPSSFSDRGYTINPPYRRMYFRQQQDGDDDSIAEMYARSNDVDKETALRILSDFLSQMKEILQQKKTIVFPGLGRLRATKENNFFFVPDEDLDIYPDGFGLEPVSLKTHQETPQEVSAAVSSLEEIIRSDEPETEEVKEEPEEEAAAVEVPAEEPAPEEPAAEPEKPTSALEEPVAVETPEPTEAPAEKAVMPSWLKISIISLLSVVGLLLLALVIFLLLAQIAPDFIDSLLYTPEELRIINY